MALQFFKVLLFLFIVAPQHEALYSRQYENHPLETPSIHIHLEDLDEDDHHHHHVIGSEHANLKVLPLITSYDKFNPFEISKPLIKKQQQHVKHLVGKLTLPESWDFKSSDIEKNLKKEVALEELYRPSSLSIYENVGFNSLHGSTQIHGDPQFQDIKPVTEHIEDDIKYDFRTNTYSV